jgi:HlyD family secretion protein
VVTQIANSASVTGVATDQVTTFEVRIFLLENSYNHLVKPNQPNPFRPGMSTTVDIQTMTKANILTIPIQAVTTRTDSISGLASGDKTEPSTNQSASNAPKQIEVVFVAVGDTARMVRVKTGIQDNRNIEITNGLEGEEEVVISPFSAISRRLEDGKLVKKVEQENLFQSSK